MGQKQKLIAALLAAALFCAATAMAAPPVSAQEAKATPAATAAPSAGMLKAAPTPPSPAADAAYLTLVDKAVSDLPHADWCKIRDLYADTSFYRSHRPGMFKEDTAKAAENVIADNTRDNEIAFNVYLRQNFGDIGTHSFADTLFKLNTYGFIDDNLHTTAERGLMECLIDTGDTQSIKTALHVISFEEMEDIATQVFDMNPESIEGMPVDGKAYLMMHMKNEAGTRHRAAYFLLDDRMMAQMDKNGLLGDKLKVILALQKAQKHAATEKITEEKTTAVTMPVVPPAASAVSK